MIVITGWRSRIAEELRALLPAGEHAVRAEVGGAVLEAERYFFCQGLLRDRPAAEQTQAEAEESVRVNLGSIAVAVAEILKRRQPTRICIIGSESGYRGSHDDHYASLKAELHELIEETPLTHPGQQLVGIAPSIIGDAGMTLRRTDTERLEARRRAHPKKRFVTSFEVASLAHYLLYGPADYITGTVIRMHGMTR